MKLNELINLVHDEIKNLVETYPNAQYSPELDISEYCQYTTGTVANTNLQGCIVGNAIINVAPELKDKLIKFDDTGSDDVIYLLQYLYDYPELTRLDQTTKEKLTFIHAIQKYQDAHVAWGEAFKELTDPNFNSPTITSEDIENMLKDDLS